MDVIDVHPQVFVCDMDRAVAFYRDALGFTVVYVYGDPPFYALVRRGGAGLNLRHVDDPVWDDDVRNREVLVSASIIVSDVAALHAELAAAGVGFAQELEEQPWGARDFIVRDPDGNLVLFTST